MNKIINSCCFTGYRPAKMPFPLYSDNPDYIKFENKLTDAVFSLPAEGCYTFYSGMAMGFDLIAAETVLLLKDAIKDKKIQLVCAVPFPDQAAKYPSEWLKRYSNVLNSADKIINISNNYFKGCYQKRNEFMVNHSDMVLTWFDGQAGGTRNTLIYAKKSGRKIVNLQGLGIHEYLENEEYSIYEDE